MVARNQYCPYSLCNSACGDATSISKVILQNASTCPVKFQKNIHQVSLYVGPLFLGGQNEGPRQQKEQERLGNILDERSEAVAERRETLRN
jgi:hypothetical protein